MWMIYWNKQKQKQLNFAGTFRGAIITIRKERCQNTINNICNQPTSTIEEYKASLDGVVDIVNPQEEYNKVREELQKIIDDKDYLAALKVINNKGLLPSTNLPNVFGWKSNITLNM